MAHPLLFLQGPVLAGFLLAGGLFSFLTTPLGATVSLAFFFFAGGLLSLIIDSSLSLLRDRFGICVISVRPGEAI